jgi:thioredoxin-related protein
LVRRAICGLGEKTTIALAPNVFGALALGCVSIEDGGVKNYRFFLFAIAASVFTCGPFAVAEESGWLTDYKKAQQEAKAGNKFLLLDFTGSDWCGWCKKFDREVLLKPQFKDYARDNLIVVELDFPRAKQQSPELRKQNRELAQEYQIVGFPTIVVLSADGQKLWRYDGYFPDGPDAFIAELQKLRKG